MNSHALNMMCKYHMTVHVRQGGVTDVSCQAVNGEVRERHDRMGAEQATVMAILKMAAKAAAAKGGQQ